MITKELLNKIHRIQIITNRQVNDILAGQYHSAFKGRGMEFDEVSEYQPGDDVRTIDWNVTARTGKPYIKKFVEERELTVMLVVDASASGKFGSVDRFKNEYAAELCAVLAFSAIKNNDKVGLIIFTDRVEMYIPPKKGKRHVLRVVSNVLSFKPERKGTNIESVLEFLSSVNKRRSIAFFISDFLDENFKRPLQIASRRHDVIPVIITDPREKYLPNVGMIDIYDAETGEAILFDTSDQNSIKHFKNSFRKYINNLDRVFRQNNISPIYVENGGQYMEAIIRFFRARVKRR